jgi:hypothetical protein
LAHSDPVASYCSIALPATLHDVTTSWQYGTRVAVRHQIRLRVGDLEM